MDRNQATGLVLFAVLLLVYSYFFASSPEVPAEPLAAQTETSISPATDQPTAPTQLPDSSAASAALVQQYGALASLASGEEQQFTVENDLASYVFSTKGAKLLQVELKEFTTWDKQPLILLDENSFEMNWTVETPNGTIDLSDLYFQTSQIDQTITGEDSVQIDFVATLPNGGQLIQQYKLYGDSYVVDYNLVNNGVANQFTGENLTWTWKNKLKKQEMDLKESRSKATINYYTTAGDFDYLSSTSESDDESISESLKWVAFKQKFFTTAVIAENGLKSAAISKTTPSDTLSVKDMQATYQVALTDFRENKTNYSFYFGPNDYKILKKVSPDFEKNVDLGYPIVSWVNKYIIINIFQILERFIGNYGIIIIIMVILIKLVLLPLSYKSYISMAKMKVLKPELDKLKEEFGDDPAKMQKEQMSLYSKVGVNPLSGCIPLLLQMPILFAMFFFFPNSIELRQEPFLWAADLSTYDSVLRLPFEIPFYGSHVSLFTLLMTASTILYTWSNNQVSSVSGPMKNIGYIMPVMFMFVLNSFPAALSFYYFVSNIITFGQQSIIRKFVDDDKIRQKLEENKKKNVNKKKSKFQQRIEEAMKQAEESKKKK